MELSGLDARMVLNRGQEFRLDVRLRVEPGVTVALLGPNGAGKTTVVSALAGLAPLAQGHIILDGRTLDDPAAGIFVAPEERRIGVVFQDYLLFPHLSAVDNVAFGLTSRGVARQEARKRSLDWLELMGLVDVADRKPTTLSGGQSQRVALARALAIDPDILLLDEPLAALDVTTRVETRRALAQHLSSFPGPRLLITHDPTEAFLLADQVCVVEAGAVTQTGTPEEIRLTPKTAYAADLAGSNLFEGIAGAGDVDVGGHLLRIVDRSITGPVLVTIRPAAVTVHRTRPEGSSRNAWVTAVEALEPLGERVRIRTGGPLALTAEITRAATEELDLAAGSSIWVSIKATEIGVEVSG